MADNMNDEGLDLDEASFDDFEKKKGSSLGDLWRNNSTVKIGAVVAAAATIFGAILLFGGKDAPLAPSYVGGGSEINTPPGTEDASAAYTDAVKEENERNIEDAQKTGGSALPTPISPPVDRVMLAEEKPPEEDPLQRWRKLQEERLQREMQRSQAVAPEAVAAEDTSRTEAVQAMADAMATQMQSVLEKNSAAKPLQYKSMTSSDWLEEMAAKNQETAQKADEPSSDEDVEIILYPAGRIAYAQILTEANSDVPGPVLAQILSGPLSGSRILGSFEKQKELLTLNFDTIIVKGISIDVEAVAIDPDTTLPAMATDVDHHYLARVVLPMASAFITGMASAISESGRTNITIQGETVAEETEETDSEQEVASGIEEAGQKLSEIIDETADDIEVTVRVEAGTPMGILFLEPVIQPPEGI